MENVVGSLKQDLKSLQDETVYTDAVLLLQQTIQEQDIVKASLIYEFYPQWINDPEIGLDLLSEKYQHIEEYLAMIRWVNFPGLANDAERIDLFKNHVTMALVMEHFSIWDTLKHYLAGLWDLDIRMDLKRQVNDALLKNQEILTSQPLTVRSPSGVEQRDPTIQNWLKDYVSNVGAGDAALNRQDYLFHSDNASKLSENEKNWLIDIILVYENCRLRSDDFPGFENDIAYRDEDGQFAVLREGKVEKPTQAEMQTLEKELNAARELLRKSGVPVEMPLTEEDKKAVSKELLLGSESERQAVAQEEQNLLAAKVSLRDALYQFMTEKNVNGAQAALRLLASDGALPLLLTQDERFSQVVATEIGNRFSESIKVGFSASRRDPVYLSLLLQSLYHDRLGLKSSTSARFGLQVAARANKKQPDPGLASMIYVDLGTDQLKWSRIVEKDGNLVFEEEANT